MRYLVVAPATDDNSLGRALCVAATCRHLGQVEVAARDTGPLWVGAGSWDLPVRRFGHATQLLEMARDFRASEPLTVVAIKPLPSSLGAAWQLRRELAREGHSPWLVADIDEDDLELRRSALRRIPTRKRPRRHLRLVRQPMPGHPLAVRCLLRWAVPQSDLVTVSTNALGAAVVPAQPQVRLPHARDPRAYAAPTPSRRPRLGFLGTPRQYKGTEALGRVLAARPDAELHLLGEVPPAELQAQSARVVMHPQQGLDTLAVAYDSIDVVLLPQDIDAPQTRLQLPAKLVDAMLFGRPVVASRSAPIGEIGGDAILTVSTWDPVDEALAHLDRLNDPGERDRLGRRAHSRAMAELTTPVLAQRLRSALIEAGVPV